jgi:peptide/nickel transport system permease protein
LRLREELGLNDPIPVQFARFLTSAAQFDFGISYQM